MLTEYATLPPFPSGPIETHGSDARWYERPPVTHSLNGSPCGVDQFAPPFEDVADMSPCAPPFDQRSCCHTAIALPVLTGSTATNGSTSELTKAVPPAAGAGQLANGLGPEIVTGPLSASAAPTAARAT